MLKNSIRNINNRLDETSPKVYSHQDWDHNNYNFDSEHFNYDNFEVAPIEDEQSAYLSMCALANYSAGAVSSLGSLDAGSVQNVNLAGVNQHKACLSSIGSTMESTLQNMGNALNVRYTAEMENQGLFGGEPGQVLDLAGYLRGIADENSSDILDQIAGFGQQTGEQGGYQPQYDESVFTDPAKLSSTYQEISGRDPSTWSEEDKYVIMAYYNDLAGRTAAEKAKADENAGWATDDLSYNSIYGKYDELKAEQNKMEKMLKANGMMEYSDWEKGWQDIKAAGKALISEGSDVIGAIKEGDWKGAWHEFTEFNEQLLATGAVVTESTVSGVLKIGEYIQDGTVMALTTVASLPTAAVDYFAGTDYTGQMNDAMMDFVARDRVGEGRQWFYEGTPIGQYINDQSTLKWDSAGSQLIQDASEKAGEVAIITAATVASGGTAAPLLAGVGFLKGSGEEAERRYNLTDENGNYTNRTWKDTGLSYLSGLAEAAEWYGTSQAIGAATQGINAVKQAGFDGIKQMVSSGIAGKTPGDIARTVFRGAKNSLLEADTWIDVGTGLVDFVVDGVNTGEWHWGSLAVDTALNLGGNMLGGSVGEMLGGGHGGHPDLDIDATPKLAVDASPSHVDDAFGGKPFDPDATLDPLKIDSDSTAPMFGAGPTPKLAGEATPSGGKPFDSDATLDPFDPDATLKDLSATPKLAVDPDATQDPNLFNNPAPSQNSMPTPKLATDASSKGSGKIRSTDIDKVHAFDEYFKDVDGVPGKTYGPSRIPDEMVFDDIAEDVFSEDGDTLAEQLDNIRKKYGKNSPQAITAESTAMQFNMDYEGSLAGYEKLDDAMQAKGITSKDAFINDYVRGMMDEMGVKDYRLLDTPDAARQYFASDLDFWQHQQDISGSGIDAMKAYTGSGYGQMNSFMREVTDDASHYAKESITELAGVLDNFELQEDTIFFRGVDDLNYTLKEYGLDTFDRGGSYMDKIERLDKGISKLGGGVMTISDNGFLSTTPVMGEGFTWKDVVEVIYAPKGTKGSFVDTFSSVPTEVEFLFQAGAGNKQVVQAVKQIGEQVFVFTKIVP